MIQLLQYCDISEQLWFRICIVVSTIKYVRIYPSPKQKFMLISAINVKPHYDSGYRLHCVIYQPSVVELLWDFIFKLIKSNHLSPLHFLSSFPSSFQIFFLQNSLHIPSTHFEWVCSIIATSNEASSKIAKQQKLWLSNGLKRATQPLNSFCLWNFSNFRNMTQKH